MRVIPKKVAAQFIVDATAVIVASGGRPTGFSDGLEHALETLAGKLYATPSCSESKLATVYLRFDAPTRANQLIPAGDWLNPHSGKWNIHQYVPAAALDELRRRLDRVTEEPAHAQ